LVTLYSTFLSKLFENISRHLSYKNNIENNFYHIQSRRKSYLIFFFSAYFLEAFKIQSTENRCFVGIFTSHLSEGGVRMFGILLCCQHPDCM